MLGEGGGGVGYRTRRRSFPEGYNAGTMLLLAMLSHQPSGNPALKMVRENG